MTRPPEISPPGDKSITHRALLMAGLMRRPAEIRNALTGADSKSTARVLRALGVGVGPMQFGRAVRVEGKLWRQPDKTLDCGNSGTTSRLLLGALAGHRFSARVDGDPSLRKRPMKRVTTPLMQMGAVFRDEHDGCLPLEIVGGKLREIRYSSPVASAQVKSAILLAGLTAGVPVRVIEPGLSRDHSERLFRYLGIDVRTEGLEVELVAPGDSWMEGTSFELEVPGDPSSAAFLVAAAILSGNRELLIKRVCVNPTRIGFLGVLDRMGAEVHQENTSESAGEPVADLVVRPTQLKGTTVQPEEIPGLIDEIPILAVLAARAVGETVFKSVAELRVKESDRLESIVNNLRRIGACAEVSGDDLFVNGSDRPLAGRIETEGDHRIAMAFSVLDGSSGVELHISETASSGISYPNFFEHLQVARGNV